MSFHQPTIGIMMVSCQGSICLLARKIRAKLRRPPKVAFSKPFNAPSLGSDGTLNVSMPGNRVSPLHIAIPDILAAGLPAKRSSLRLNVKGLFLLLQKKLRRGELSRPSGWVVQEIRLQLQTSWSGRPAFIVYSNFIRIFLSYATL